MKEIGSTYWMSDEKYREILAGPVISSNEYEAGGEDKAYFSTARQAIRFCLQDLQADKKTALLPEFTCASVIQPFQQEGFSLYFYPLDAKLRVSTKTINELLVKHKADVLLMHPYFGFNTIDEDEAIIEGTTVIYDATQSFFSGFSYSQADYIVASIRKWGPFPEGAYCVKRYGEFANKARFPEDEEYLTLIKQAFLRKAAYIEQDSGDKDEFRKLYSQAQTIIRSRSDLYRMSEESMNIYKRYDFASMICSRRANYQTLLEYSSWDKLGDLISPVLSAEVVPLYFTMMLTKTPREKFQHHLAGHDIYAPVIWPKAPFFDTRGVGEQADRIYSRILSIPMDQRYSTVDMQKIISVIELYEN
ncbi:MAG: hypothetical protein GX777_07845 [Fastidiosipila sp.]|nr:hypothetical protein [Fastidiosipila sp.]